MKELVEFRVKEKYAAIYFPEDLGVRLTDTVRKITVEANSIIYDEIGRIYKGLKDNGETLYYSSNTKRSYSKEELEKAELFQMWSNKNLEYSFEESGMIYDETTMCPICHSGANLKPPFDFNARKMPHNIDLCRTLDEQHIVSLKFKNLCNENGFKGAAFYPINRDWFFMDTESEVVIDTAKTLTGIEPFDEDIENKYRCPMGDLIGLNLLSELYIEGPIDLSVDLMSTRQYTGSHFGSFRPGRSLLCSPRLREMIVSHKLRGCYFEVAYVT